MQADIKFFSDYCTNKFQVILADPPWQYRNRARGAAFNSYDLMSMEDMKNLKINNLADKDCVLFMWTTFPQIQEALDLIKAWGFTYKTGAAWHKITKNGKDAFGPGFFFRSASELLFLATKGHPKLKTRDNRNIITAITQGHSRKPDIQYQIIERMFDGPYLELYARRERKGWISVGNQLEESNSLLNF